MENPTVVPSLAPQEGKWIARPRKPRWAPYAFGGFMLLFQLPNWIHLIFRMHQEHPILAAFMIAITVLSVGAIILRVIHERIARRKALQDLALVDGGFGDQYPAEVTLVVQSKRLTTDQGVVWFADGLIGFSGASFSFVLGASDLAPQWVAAKRRYDKGSVPVGALGLRGVPGKSYLQIVPFRGRDRSYWDRLRQFVNTDERPEGDRFWPPLERYEEAPTEMVVRR